MSLPDSQVNLLLGARKFTEGWNSWRVSNMTLMNVGRGEAAQIIQLFGRGVRLKGWSMSLKRSSDIVMELKQNNIERPNHINVLETLNIFGLNADYIARFREELEDEGIPVNEGLEEFVLPLQPMQGLPQDLNIIKVQQKVANRALGGAGSAFMELAEQVVLKTPTELKHTEQDYFCNPPRVIVNFYPRIGAFATVGQTSLVPDQNQKLTRVHLALLDMEKLYFELLDFKRSKRWANLTISIDVVKSLLNDDSWYTLQAPKEQMLLGKLQNLTLWHDMAISLLRKYCEMFYNFRRNQWEADKLEYRRITEDKSYLPGVREDCPDGAFVVTLDPGRQKSFLKQLEIIRDKLVQNEPASWRDEVVDGLQFLHNERHFYQPLLALAARKPDYQVSPVPLNRGEAQFVKDVQSAWEDGLFGKDTEVFLLRNLSGKGAIGVFIDGGFEPDFILWIKNGAGQKIVFLDPKGLRQYQPTHPKIQFYRTIKKLESRLRENGAGSDHIEMHAFLLSETRASVLKSLWREHEGKKVTRDLMESWNILFPHDDDKYMHKLINQLV